MTLNIIIPPILLILFILWGVFIIIAFSSYNDLEDATPFECGLDNISSARLPFSVRFFLLAVVFLVFDIETALLLPLPVTAIYSTTPLISIILFIIILILGLIHEWRENTLQWSS